MIGWPVLSLCQITLVSARMRGQYADDDAGVGAAAVAFQVQLALEGLVDRLDGLAQWLEQCCAGPLGFALTGRTQQLQLTLGELGFEDAAVVVPISDDRLSRMSGQDVGCGLQHAEQYLALIGLGAAEGVQHRQSARRVQQVQPKPQKYREWEAQ